MDAAIVTDTAKASCRKLRDIRAGDRIVCGLDGIRVVPEFKARDRLGFAFMNTEVSSERRVEASVGRIAEMFRETKRQRRKIAFVAGPVVAHTGGIPHFCELIRRGFVDVILAGNALAIHDIERRSSARRSASISRRAARSRAGIGNHMRAINAIRRAGGIAAAVESGILQSGVMYECVRRGVPFLLAGSIRDDGPLPETMMDLVEAQDRYAAALKDVGTVVVLSSMLHGIGVGNMVPAWVRMVCVDINPAVITKLADRGSSQTLGVVTDVGLFLHHLAARLAAK